MRPLGPALALSALFVASCATVPRYAAAIDIHAFLVAIRDGDTAGFEAHVDRAALKVQLKSRLLGETAKAYGPRSLAALGAAAGAPLVDIGVEALVRPSVFRAEAIRLGYDPNAPLPGALSISALVRPLGAGRACVTERRGGPCVFDFNDEGGVWRLTGYEGPFETTARKPR